MKAIGRLRKAKADTQLPQQSGATATASVEKGVTPPKMGKTAKSTRTQPVDRADSVATPTPAAPTPPTFQQNYQQGQQQAAAAYDPAAAAANLQSFLDSLKKPGMFNFRQKQEQQQFTQQAQAAMQDGLTQDEVNQLMTGRQGEQFKGHEKGGSSFNQSALQALQGAGSVAGQQPSGIPGGDQNPFLTGQVTQTFGPQVGNISSQMMTQADQQLASDQQISQHAQSLYGEIGASTNEAGQRIEGLQREGQNLHQGFTEERKDLSQQVAQLPSQVNAEFDAAINDFTGRIASAQGVIDAKESAAMAGVMAGKNAAMSAAVQGIQGNVNAAISQIQSNPNLTDSQKQSMIAQTRLQGATQMAPAVGQTILQFNQLAAQTAVSFGNMTTQIQNTGLAVTGDLLGRKASTFADTAVAAGQLGANLLATQQSADANYLSTQAQLESTRSTIELSGDQLRASLLPEMGIPYADYATPMLADLQMNFDLSKQEFQSIMGRNQYELAAWMAAQQARGANTQMLASLAQNIGGPLGAAIGFGATAVQGISNMGGGQAPPTLPGGGGYNPATPWRL